MKQNSHQKTVMKIAQSVWIYVKRYWSWSETLSFAWSFYKKNQTIYNGKILKATPNTCDQLCSLAMRSSYMQIRVIIEQSRIKEEEIKRKEKEENSLINRLTKWIKTKLSVKLYKTQTV